MARGRTTSTTLALFLPTGLAVVSMAGQAEAATPTYYNNLPAFQADVTFTVTDDYQNPAYLNNQSNAVMSAVLGQTDYFTTGFLEWNLVPGGYYCAGCNGSFELSFQTTTVGTPAGVNGVGMNILYNDPALPYFAYITFADGTTANIQLPSGGSYWGVAAPERIERIHFGLSMGGTTQAGSFGIDNLIVGDSNIGTCVVSGDCVEDMNPCTDAVCQAGMCAYVANAAPCDDGNMCTDEACSGGVCMAQFNASPCDDGEVCTENDVCAVGVCQGSLLDCSDGNVCTTDFCDFGVGCASVINDAPCDDGNVCTQMDACSGGVCEGSAISCSDDDMCTMDSCDPVMGCVSEPTPGCCDADEDCGDDQVCDLDTSTCVDIPTASSSSGEETGTPTDTGMPADTGVDDTGGGSGVADSGGVDTGGTGSTGPADTGIALDSGELPTPDLSGCGCTTTPSPRARLWWLMVPLGLRLRRRRRAA